MSSTIREINGFTFCFTHQRLFVAIDGCDTSDSAYLAALVEAKRLHETYQAITWEYYSFRFGHGLALDTDEDLRETLQHAETALSQTDWELPPYDAEHVRWVVREVPKELARRQTGETPEPHKTKVFKRPQNRHGFVYLVKEVNGPHFKIGRSKNPNPRTRAFGVKLPYRVDYECFIQASDMVALEKELHQRFANKRADGEWFALSPEDVAYIKALAGDATDER